MTVATETSAVRFSSIVDGVPLSCNFPCPDADFVVVRYGDDVVATAGVHYSVTLAGDFQSFTVTPIAGFAVIADGPVCVSREVPATQEFELLTREDIASSALTRALDYLTYQTQQLTTRLDRMVSFPSTDDPATEMGNLPNAETRAGKYLTFDEHGKPATADTVELGDLVVSVWGRAWANLASSVSGLTTLGFTTVGDFGKQLVATTSLAAAQALLGFLEADDDIAFTGDNTFTGAVDFTGGSIIVPTPAVDNDAATKKYVDDEIAAISSGGGAPVNQSVVGPTIQNVTATGTYTTAVGAKWIKARVRGAGGSGGGDSTGGAGANTSFNAIVAAPGSGGGMKDTAGGGALGGAGGTGGAGAADLRRPGARGQTGSTSNGTAGVGGSGGGAGGTGSIAGAGGSAAANSGGGGGGHGDVSATDGGGGGGGEGEYVEIIISNPTATYAVVIGAGGTVSGGGSGGSGHVSVEEHYNY